MDRILNLSDIKIENYEEFTVYFLNWKTKEAKNKKKWRDEIENKKGNETFRSFNVFLTLYLAYLAQSDIQEEAEFDVQKDTEFDEDTRFDIQNDAEFDIQKDAELDIYSRRTLNFMIQNDAEFDIQYYDGIDIQLDKY